MVLRKNFNGVIQKIIDLKLFKFKKIIVFEKFLNEPISDFKGKLEVVVDSLPADIVIKTKIIRNKERVSDRLKKGHICFVAKKDQEVLCYVWVAFDSIYVSEIQRELKIAKNEVYLYDGYTMKEYRNLGLFTFILSEILKYLKKQGYQRAFGMVLNSNYPSLHSFEKNCKKIGTITYIKIFNFKKLLYREIKGKKID